MTLRLALVGATGRLGGQILRVLPEFPGIGLVAAVVSQGSPAVDRAVAGADVRYSADIDSAVAMSDLVIDCSRPDASLTAARGAARYRKPLVVCTTGFNKEQLAELKELASSTALAVVPNTSLGVFALSQIAAQAAAILGADFDVEIFELHHRAKRDAPSGTALALATALQASRTLEVSAVSSRQRGVRGRAELGIESLRGGDVAGDHTVFFLGDGERLELTHRVTDRAVFARGALRIATRLRERGPGLYAITDLLRS